MVSEIKVSYSNTNNDKIKISDSQTSYKVALAHWDLSVIEFVEEVKVILLNNANMVLGIYDLARGGTSSCVVDLKIILSVALKTHSSAIILIHNHPAGKVKPSQADKTLTTRLKKACGYLDISLLDHLIITKDQYYSFNDMGIL